MKKSIPFLCLGLAAALWSGYWFMGSSAIVNTFAEAQDSLAEDGISLTASDLKVRGYPLNFKTDLTDTVLSGAEMRIEPKLVQISAKAYRPNVWTLSSDKPTRIKLQGAKGETWDFFLTGEKMRVEMQSTVSGKLQSVDANMKSLKAIAAPNGGVPPITAVEIGALKLVPNEAPIQDGMRTAFNIRGVKLADGAAGNLQRAFGSFISRIEGTGVATQLATLDSDDIDIWKQGGGLTIPDFELDWGDVSFIGEVNIDMSAGRANGVASLGVTDPDALITAFVNAGMLNQTQALGATFLLMAAPKDAQGRTVLEFPIVDNAITLLGQPLHQF